RPSLSTEKRRLAGEIYLGRECCLPRRLQGPAGLLDGFLFDSLRDWLQHEAGPSQGCTDQLRRSLESQVEKPDRFGDGRVPVVLSSGPDSGQREGSRLYEKACWPNPPNAKRPYASRTAGGCGGNGASGGCLLQSGRGYEGDRGAGRLGEVQRADETRPQRNSG